MTITTYTDREISLRQRVADLEQGRDEWKDSIIAANANAASEEKRRRAIQDERDTLRQQLAEAQARINSLEELEKQLSDNVIWQAGEIAKHLDAIEASRKQSPFTYYVPATDKIRPFRSDGDLPLYVAPVVADDVLKDAQRYRWLREQSFMDNLCVVDSPKNSVKLGSFCPSHGRLDAAIDKAIGGQQ